MKKAFFTLVLAALALSSVNSQESPATAEDIMNKAKAIATKENKDIFLMFHASWCGWCKKMDQSMNDEMCSDYFDNNFVTIHMVVKESAANKHLENPGAAEFLASYGGDKSGIPFWLIFDSKGNLVADSFMENGERKSNIGCPAQDNEIEVFISKLKMAAKMSDEEEKSITERFRKNRN